MEELKQNVSEIARVLREHLGDHDLLVKVSTTQDLMFKAMQSTNTSLEERMKKLEADMAWVKQRIYAGVVLLLVLQTIFQIFPISKMFGH